MSLGDVGDVDLFGLDEFGQPAGLNPIWGAVGGSVVGTGVAMAARQMSLPGSFASVHSEAVGAGVAIVAGGLLAAFPATRAAGWTAMATALVNNGLRAVENLMSHQATAGAWGEVRVEPTRAFAGHLGMVTAEQRANLGAAQLPTLVGAGQLGTPARQVQIMGGPAVSSLAGHYGATIFGSGN